MKKHRSPNHKRERRKFTSAQSRPASSLRLLNSTWLVWFLRRLHWHVCWRIRKPEHREENETRCCFVDRVPSNKRRNTKWISWNSSSPSSETQGQLVGPEKSLNGREKNAGEEKSRYSGTDFCPLEPEIVRCSIAFRLNTFQKEYKRLLLDSSWINFKYFRSLRSTKENAS